MKQGDNWRYYVASRGYKYTEEVAVGPAFLT